MISSGTQLLRAHTATDDALLELLFRQSRGPELAALPDDAARQFFVAMQLAAREAQYERLHPAAEKLVILDTGSGTDTAVAIGRLLLDATPQALHIVDVGIVVAAQRRGHGRAVFTELAERADAAGIPITLTAEIDNTGARAFYRALGFIEPAHGPDPAGRHLTLTRLPLTARRTP